MPEYNLVLIVKLCVAVAVGFWLSDALTVKFQVPLTTAFPKIAPVKGLRKIPGGKFPAEIVQVKFPEPPDACKV